MDATLILSPHMDDEVLGCSTFLFKGTHVLYFTSCHPVMGQQPLHESIKLCSIYGLEGQRCDYQTNELDKLGAWLLVRIIEDAVEACKPHTVLVPPASYNQDHRAVYDAAQIALRPHFSNWSVKRVLVYEEPETIQTMRPSKPFTAIYFRPLDIALKETMYGLYQSQVRPHRSLEQIRALAVLRGGQCSLSYAEAFEVLRWVD